MMSITRRADPAQRYREPGKEQNRRDRRNFRPGNAALIKQFDFEVYFTYQPDGFGPGTMQAEGNLCAHGISRQTRGSILHPGAA